ncbi:hypothetical protein HPULCUR_011330 [Helicostylum pulchrum]|uniref:Uncharacterized protein n=1 Tax=Helicostylum pulchrum TaxID=562976 RepID=A0ABP9YFS8_9FUNG
MPRIVLYPEPEALLRRKRQQKYDERVEDDNPEQMHRDTPEDLRAKKKSRQERDKETAAGSSTGKKRSVQNETMIKRLIRIFDGSFEHCILSIPFNTVVKPRFKSRFLRNITVNKRNNRKNLIVRELLYYETYQGKLRKYPIYKLSVEFPEIASYIIKKIVDDYALLLITNTEEPRENAFDTIENEQLRTRLRLFINNGTLINHIKKLPTSTRQNPLTKAIILRNPGSLQERYNVTVSENILQATEKLTRLATILLQGTQATIAAVETTINSAKVLVNLAKTAVVASQAPNEDEDLQLLLTTCLRNIRGASATSKAVSFNSNVNVDIILRSSRLITTNVTDVTNSMNHNFVSSSRTKELIQTALLCITNIRNISERLATAILDSVNSSENINNYIRSIDRSSTDILTTIQNTLTQARNNVTVSEAVIPQAEGRRNASERLLQILQDLTDSVMIDHRIVSGAEPNTTHGININSFAPQGNTANTDYESTLIKFYEAFDFSKFPNLKIRSAQDLSTLPDRMNKIVINEVKTDGYTCRFTFARRRTKNPTVKLELEDFTQDEIDLYFRPCTVDPGRNHVFTSFHGDKEIRRMSTKEFYSYGGTLQCLKSQKAQDAAVIILINGGKKYNKKRRKRPKTSKNKRRRRNNRKNRLANAPVLPSASAPVTTPFSR